MKNIGGLEINVTPSTEIPTHSASKNSQITSDTLLYDSFISASPQETCILISIKIPPIPILLSKIHSPRPLPTLF